MTGTDTHDGVDGVWIGRKHKYHMKKNKASYYLDLNGAHQHI